MIVENLSNHLSMNLPKHEIFFERKQNLPVLESRSPCPQECSSHQYGCPVSHPT